MASLFRLSNELLDIIVSYLFDASGPEFCLRQASLVCKKFAVMCQGLLFKSVTVKLAHKACGTGTDFLAYLWNDDNRRLRSYIREVTVKLGYGALSRENDLQQAVFQDVLPKIPNLRVVRFDGDACPHMAPALVAGQLDPHTVYAAQKIPNVEAVTLAGYIPHRKDKLQLNRVPKLTCLRVLSTGPSKDNKFLPNSLGLDICQGLQRNAKLKHLCIHFPKRGEDTVLEHLIHMLHATASRTNFIRNNIISYAGIDPGDWRRACGIFGKNITELESLTIEGRPVVDMRIADPLCLPFQWEKLRRLSIVDLETASLLLGRFQSKLVSLEALKVGGIPCWGFCELPRQIDDFELYNVSIPSLRTLGMSRFPLELLRWYLVENILTSLRHLSFLGEPKTCETRLDVEIRVEDLDMIRFGCPHLESLGINTFDLLLLRNEKSRTGSVDDAVPFEIQTETHNSTPADQNASEYTKQTTVPSAYSTGVETYVAPVELVHDSDTLWERDHLLTALAAFPALRELRIWYNPPEDTKGHSRVTCADMIDTFQALDRRKVGRTLETLVAYQVSSPVNRHFVVNAAGRDRAYVHEYRWNKRRKSTVRSTTLWDVDTLEILEQQPEKDVVKHESSLLGMFDWW